MPKKEVDYVKHFTHLVYRYREIVPKEERSDARLGAYLAGQMRTHLEEHFYKIHHDNDDLAERLKAQHQTIKKIGGLLDERNAEIKELKRQLAEATETL